MTITKIGAQDVHRISSGQVITDMVSVVKELVENSIDAKSTKIDLTFVNYGLDSIEVNDDGLGISKVDYSSLCLKHYTSKLDDFELLSSVSTLGFRGEAMSSLCAIGSVSITTCTHDEYPRATQLDYDHMGQLVKQKKIVGGIKGTRVQVSKIFLSLPVRRKSLEKSLKREFNKAVNTIITYLLIYPEIRFTVFNVNAQGKKSLLMGTKGTEKSSTVDNMVSVYGRNGGYGLVPIDIVKDDLDIKRLRLLSDGDFSGKMSVRFSGYISNCSFGLGRSSTDRQFLYVNRRPIIMKKFLKTINEVYKSYNHIQSPVVLINITIDTYHLDVNVTPDKRVVMIHNENLINEVLRDELTKFYKLQSTVIPRNKNAEISLDDESVLVLTSTQRIKTEREKVSENKSERKSDEESGRENDKENDNESEKELNESPYIHDKTVALPQLQPSSIQESEGGSFELFVSQEDREEESDIEEDPEIEEVKPSPEEEMEVESEEEEESENVEPENDVEVEEEVPRSVLQEMEVDQDEQADVDSTTKPLLDASAHVDSDSDSELANINTDTLEEILSQSQKPNLQEFISPDTTHQNHEDHECCDKLRITIGDSTEERIAKRPKVLSNQRDVTFESVKKQENLYQLKLKLDVGSDWQFPNKVTPSKNKQLQVEVDDITQKEAAEAKLSYIINKQDFTKMRVIGQFNLGFILVTLEESNNLFIIDQHASDEKYNYERYLQSIDFEKSTQSLIIPKTIELNIIDEMVVHENIDIFKHNGFIVNFNEVEEKPGQRIQLLSLPVLKHTKFDTSDLHELIHLISERGSKQQLKCSKWERLLASRACRTSTMIGQSLTHKRMQTIVNNLSTLDKPWNCPHGRPTMRHLIELQQIPKFNLDYGL